MHTLLSFLAPPVLFAVMVIGPIFLMARRGPVPHDIYGAEH